MLGRFVIEKARESPVVGIGFSLPVSRKQAHVVLQLVEVDGFFNQNTTAHNQQVVEQSWGEMLDKILRFVQERGAKSGNVSHVTKHVFCPRFY